MELIITMVILTILAVYFAPRIHSPIQALKVQEAAQKIALDIRYARELALSRHATYGISFNAGANSYQLFQMVSGSAVVLTNPHTGAAMTIDLDTATEYAGVDLVSASVSEIRFNEFGTPYNNLGTALSSTATVVLQISSITRTVSLYPQTAFTEIS